MSLKKDSRHHNFLKKHRLGPIRISTSDYSSSPLVCIRSYTKFDKIVEEITWRKNHQTAFEIGRMSFEDDSLCPKCRRVDWRELAERPLDPEFNRKKRDEDEQVTFLGRFVQTMTKSHNQLKSAKCRVCLILSIIKDEDKPKKLYVDQPNIRNLEVTTLGSEVLLEPPICSQGSLELLQIGNWHSFNDETESGYGYRQGKLYIALIAPGKDPAPHRIPPFIGDFTWIRNAISECCQQYESCLGANPLFVPELLVIDCLAASSTLSLVPLPKSCKYVALSYVWGCAHTTITKVPAVIKDANEVTLKLGLRFIWVDRYCIRQDDPEKHRLILSMDEIYAKAYITITAAAGKTAADGLPGISTIPPAFMKDWNILQTLFATKRAVFAIQFRIVEFTRRHLSYPQDSLDAFLGVFAAYEQQRAACPEVSVVIDSASPSVCLPSHAWGLPFIDGVPLLHWYHPEPPKRRRPDFPTWSWSGWEGGIEFEDHYLTNSYGSTDLTYAPIFVEIPDKSTDFYEQKTKCLACHNHVMFEEQAPGIFAVIRLTLGIEPEVGEPTFGLLFTTEIGSGEEKRFSIRGIIVLRKGDKGFTRIGCMRLEDFWVRKHVSIDGASIAKEVMPPFNDRRYFGQEFTRQRICLE
ncbi:uncharacterized protein EAE98_008874 [Botrytis deweyae]|uniref:Heterokaryon incompatibility domain-containing protein n=1 Tax=Botrytis deweyae TaxID=2478750 RepID=A0ABQ7IDB2_9HELO|nr:uncharacterized protein EAE98_008874 [Botrytis deweyae]KAF7920845.1 hypothetical protein EAE98_008874 [Botrytis deweyae]